MNTQINVKEVEELLETISNNERHYEEVLEAMDRRMRQLNSLVSECQKERAHSKELLDKAIERERRAREAKERAAEIERATRGTKAHPAAYAWWVKCCIEHKAALKHLADMRRRYAMAVEANGRANELFSKVQADFSSTKERVRNTSDRCNKNIKEAYDTIHKYFALTNPEIREDHKKWEEQKCEENKPITFYGDIKPRLNPGRNVLYGILASLYATDAKFRSYVDEKIAALRTNPQSRDVVETQIRRNIVGRLAEELVIRAFKPFATSVNTQAVAQVNDEHYTKTDLIVSGLKETLIWGNGKTTTPKGGSIGIEVKAGKPEYLRAQKEHILFQTAGHSGCDTSCIMCTHDLHEISSEHNMRCEIQGVGAYLYAALPMKSEMDDVAVDFVLNKGSKANV